MGNSQTTKLTANKDNMEVYAPSAVAELKSISSSTYNFMSYLCTLLKVTEKPMNRAPLIKAGMIEALVEKLVDEKLVIYNKQLLILCLLNLSLCDEGKQVIINKGLERVIEDYSGASALLPNETNAEISVFASRILESCHRYKQTYPIATYQKE